MHPLLLPLATISYLWYAMPLIVVVSLVYAATRHEYMGPILAHATRFGVWIFSFVLIVLLILAGLSWFT